MSDNNIDMHQVGKLFELVRNSAASSMKHLLKATDEDLTTLDLSGSEDLSYDHWICCIVVKFEGLSVVFSVHFTSKAARQLAEISIGKNRDELPPRITHDFMKEYCNLTAGTIKDRLQKCEFGHDGGSTVMLPSEVPSFDTVKLRSEDSHWLMNWLMSHKGQDALIFSGKIEVENAAILSKLSKIDDSSIMIDDSGEIDFL
jgi:hypothetical protein